MWGEHTNTNWETPGQEELPSPEMSTHLAIPQEQSLGPLSPSRQGQPRGRWAFPEGCRERWPAWFGEDFGGGGDSRLVSVAHPPCLRKQQLHTLATLAPKISLLVSFACVTTSMYVQSC